MPRRRPRTARPSTSSPRSTGIARHHPPDDDGRARGDRHSGPRRGGASDGPALRREPLRRSGRAPRGHRLDPADRHPRAPRPLRAAAPALPGYLETCAEIALEGVATGVVSPRIVVERAVAQIERIVGSPAEDSPPLAAIAEDDAAARERIAGVWSDVVAPAFATYLDVLREYLPNAAERNAVTASPTETRSTRRRSGRGPPFPSIPRRSTTWGTSGGKRSKRSASRSPRSSGTPARMRRSRIARHPGRTPPIPRRH